MQTFAYIMNIINLVLCGLFVLCYSYQFFYTLLVLFKKKKKLPEGEPHRIAVLSCARNEEGVIAQLIDSLKKQDYDPALYEIFVLADNCTDRTAEVARESGATRVWERQNREQVGKGYALHYLLSKIDEEFGADAFDGYLVFDADNLVAPNYLTEINRVFSQGYDMVCSYRNSKNYGDSWISAGSGMWFIREAKFLNNARVALGGSAWLAGTGFMFSRKIKEDQGGWPFHTLTEDVEFMVDNVLRGYRVGYTDDAEFFDEQPIGFMDSFWQRLRWARGGLQVFARYWKRLIKKCLRGDFSCMDYTVSIAPAYVLSVAAMLFNIVGTIVTLIGGVFLNVLPILLLMVVAITAIVVVFATITTVSEWKKLHAPAWKKILYIFTFVPFMLSYIPIAFFAMIMPVKWRETKHSSAASIEDLAQDEQG